MIYIYRYTDKIFIFLHNVSFFFAILTYDFYAMFIRLPIIKKVLLQQLTGIKFIPLEARKYPPIEFRLLFHDD